MTNFYNIESLIVFAGSQLEKSPHVVQIRIVRLDLERIWGNLYFGRKLS
jgi:hypothetical protein